MFPFSEVHIKRNSWDGSDIVKTNVYFGGQLNLIYPAPEILISQRFYRQLREKNIKGFRIEVAHLV
jgi:superfamily II DNA helicase RecQ